MGHEDLKQIGVTAYGHRHKLIKGLEKLMSGNGKNYNCFIRQSNPKYCDFIKYMESIYINCATFQLQLYGNHHQALAVNQQS